ncbi:hypothetical protein P9112_003274 [Eukaryota sp. TZLM1-RC]
MRCHCGLFSSSSSDSRLVFANRFLCDTSRRVGSGSFGSVFSGEILDTNEPIAVKIEKKRKNNRKSSLAWEAKVYAEVGSFIKPPDQPPDFLWYGEQHGYRALVMRLLGPSLEDVFQLVNEYVASNHKRFSPSTCCVLAVLMIQILEAFHENGYIHRDVKPANFLMGLDSSVNELRMIDLGLVCNWQDPITRNHIPFDQRDDVSLIGTPRFASINSHNGCTLSRRDDLESVCYTLLYLLKGTLPWWDIDFDGKDRQWVLDQMKKKKINGLCGWFNNVPIEFSDFLSYVKKLGFEEKPDYGHWVGVFIRLYSSLTGSSVSDIRFVKCDWHK